MIKTHTEEDTETREVKQEIEKETRTEQPMGDVYDVYGKAVKVHSKLTNMTADYTLTRYNRDLYNEKLPKFIREQRKLLRIIKSYMIIPLYKLKEIYNTEKQAKEIYNEIRKEYEMVEELLIGELDETVIMGRTPEGEVISAFLKHGMTMQQQEEHRLETEGIRPMKERLGEDQEGRR